jgi:hypothetical protein
LKSTHKLSRSDHTSQSLATGNSESCRNSITANFQPEPDCDPEDEIEPGDLMFGRITKKITTLPCGQKDRCYYYFNTTSTSEKYYCGQKLLLHNILYNLGKLEPSNFSFMRLYISCLSLGNQNQIYIISSCPKL